MSNNLDVLSSVSLAILVEYTWGPSPNVARYTSWDNDLSLSGKTFVSDPLLTLRCEPQHGSIKDSPYVITQDALRQPLRTMAQPYPHAPVTAAIEEVDPEFPSTRRLIFKGTLTKLKSNPSGKRGLVEVTVSGWKARIAFPVGVPADTRCPWIFGDQNCCKDLSLLTQVGTIDSVNGNLISTSGLTTPSVPLHYWRHGWVEVDGLVIDVLEYNSPNTQMRLRRAPPLSWIGRDDALFTPGCGKTPQYCTDWENIGNFGGIGIKIPPYHPALEDGAEG